MRTRDVLSQELKQQYHDIINVMHLDCSTKTLIQNWREGQVIKKYNFFLPQFMTTYKAVQGHSCHQKDPIIVEHYLRVEILFVPINKQLQGLNYIFNDLWSYYFKLSLILNNAYKVFNINKIYTLEQYYTMDSNEQEKINFHFQFQHFIINARRNSNLKNLATM